MNPRPPVSKEIILLESIDRRLAEQNRFNLFPNFLRGIVTGLGITLGATVVLALLIALLQNLVTVPVIGNFVEQIINEVNR